MKKILKDAFVKTLPIMAGYIVLGFGFGIILQKNGYGIFGAIAMSTFIYAGSMQYVAVGLLSSGATIITAALTTMMVNARHLFYGISMIEPYKKAGKCKPYLIFGLTDETYSLVCSGEAANGSDFYRYSFFVTLFNHLYWIVGSVLGVLAGTVITFNTAGIDFAMTALFITVFVEQWKTTRNHIPAMIGIGSSIVCLILFGSEHFLIPAMVSISVMLVWGKKTILKKGEI